MAITLTDSNPTTSYANNVEITADHFGGNALINYEYNADFFTQIDNLNVTNLRYPGGSITEQYFDISDLSAGGMVNGTSLISIGGKDFIPLKMFLQTLHELATGDIGVTIVIPTIDAFTQSAEEALIAGTYTYQDRTLRSAYQTEVENFVKEALKIADNLGIQINGFEIGNEYWGSGEMTASEYGKVANAAILGIDAALDSSPHVPADEPEILIQTTHTAGIWSPSSDGYITIGGADYPVKGQGNDGTQVVSILEGLSNNAIRALDGVVGHYYERDGFSGVDSVANILKRVNNFSATTFTNEVGAETTIDAIRSAAGLDDLTTNITEWDAKKGYTSAKGLQQASMLVEAFYEMVTHGVTSADVWPLVGSETKMIADGYGGLTLAGTAFSWMSESLIGLTADFDYSNSRLDVHGFEDAHHMVMFVSNRNGGTYTGGQLDFGDVRQTGGTYFIASATLGDGSSNGTSPDAPPDVHQYGGFMASSDAINLHNIDGWGLERIEITYVGSGNDSVLGRSGNDNIKGYGGNDTLNGGEGNDSLWGGSGNDRLIGLDGDDFIYGEDSGDSIYGGNGADYIDGGSGNDELRGDAGNDTVNGGDGGDTVIGGNGNDVLSGGSMGDQLYGGNGNDFLNGGYGHDQLNGGNGADDFYHVGVSGHGSDWVQDYDASEGDVLVFGGSATLDQFQVNFNETANSGATGVAEAFVIYRPTGQILWALVDGAAQNHIYIELNGTTYDLV